MNSKECLLLCRFAKAACPQQAIDEHTPDAWFLLLGDLRYEDAQEALVNVVKVKPFVAPAEIRAEVKKIRAARLSNFGTIPDPPAEVAADPSRFHPWLTATKRAIADGTVTRPEDLGISPGIPGDRPALTRKQLEDAAPDPEVDDEVSTEET